MVVCSAFGCRSNSCRKELGITYHRFPLRNPEKTAVWVQQMNIADWLPGKNDRICSKHFKPDSFYRLGNKAYLLDDAVPTLFTKLPEHIQHEVEHSRGSTERSFEETVDPLALTPPNVKKLEEDSVDSIGNLRRKLCKELIRSQEKSKKLKFLQQKLKRSKDKICLLAQMLKDLKRENLSSSENNMTEIYKELQNRQSGKNSHYSPELKKFASTLCSISPKAYDYVRMVFDMRLPCKNTLEKWPEKNPDTSEFVQVLRMESPVELNIKSELEDDELDPLEIDIKSEIIQVVQEDEVVDPAVTVKSDHNYSLNSYVIINCSHL